MSMVGAPIVVSIFCSERRIPVSLHSAADTEDEMRRTAMKVFMSTIVLRLRLQMGEFEKITYP